MRALVSASLLFVLAACGQAAAPSDAEAQPAQGGAQISAADRTAMLAAVSLRADARGQVTNACEEKVTPQFSTVELGGAVGAAILLIVPGGPNSLTCYGDGPGDMHLFRRNGAAFAEIHALAGAFLVVLPTSHGGVRDIATGGPGMSHPLFWWNGATYVRHGEIADSAMGEAQFYPQ